MSIYIAFEGIDGAGKSTQIELLQRRLTENNIAHTVVAMPMKDNPVLNVRNFPEEVLSHPYAGLYAFGLDAVFACAQIRRALNDENHVVISDRSIYSMLIYQAVVQRMSRRAIWRLIRRLNIALIPDLTLYIHCAPDIASARTIVPEWMLKRFGGNQTTFLQIIYNEYEAISRNARPRWKTIWACQDPNETAHAVWINIQKRISSNE